MLKDLSLSQTAAAASGTATPLGKEAERLYQVFNDLGYGETDFSAIINLLREKSQVTDR
jgi:3-hydroxyisobutyrate dehydrogenase